MPKERNKADGYREKAPIKREKSEACIDSAESEVPRPKVKAYEGDTKANDVRKVLVRLTVAFMFRRICLEDRVAANLGDFMTPTLYKTTDGIIISLSIGSEVSAIIEFNK